MAHYLLQVAYTPEGWATLLKQPQNRLEGVCPAIERLGGKIIGGWFSFGYHDAVLIVDMPDNVSAAAAAMAFAAGGACKSVKTTPLVSIEDGIEAMKKAGESGYRPAKA